MEAKGGNAFSGIWRQCFERVEYMDGAEDIGLDSRLAVDRAIDMRLGGKMNTPSIRLAHQPVELRGIADIGADEAEIGCSRISRSDAMLPA